MYAQDIIFFDEFSDFTYTDNWQLQNFCEEEDGSFSLINENLNIAQSDGHLAIFGTGTIDVINIDGQDSGNFGKSVVLKELIKPNNIIRLKTRVRAIEASNVSIGVFINFDSSNRIRLSMYDISRAGLTIEEDDSLVVVSRLNHQFQLDKYYDLELFFDPNTRVVKGYIDNTLLFENKYNGELKDYRVGLQATVRFPGDTIYSQFDYFEVSTINNSNEIPNLKQFDDRWGDDEYDHADDWVPAVRDTSISRWGCALTSANMVMQYHEVSDVLPNELNEWLKNQNDGYTRSGGVIWNTIGRYAREQDPESSTLEFQYLSSDPTDANIKKELDNGYAPILKLDNKYGGNHFIVATGVDNDNNILVNDPGSSNNETLKDAENYWGEVEKIGRYSLSNTDLSYIIQYVDDGFDIQLGSNSATLAESFDEDPLLNVQDQQELSGEPLNSLYYPKPESGEYYTTITGDVGLYQLDNYLYDVSGTSNQNSHIGFINSAGEKDVYQILFDHDDNSSSDVYGPVTSYDSLISDLNAIYDLEKIKNRGLYRSTLQLIINSQKLLEKNKTFPAKTLLTVVLERYKMTSEAEIENDYSLYLQQEISNLVDQL